MTVVLVGCMCAMHAMDAMHTAQHPAAFERIYSPLKKSTLKMPPSRSQAAAAAIRVVGAV